MSQALLAQGYSILILISSMKLETGPLIADVCPILHKVLQCTKNTDFGTELV